MQSFDIQFAGYIANTDDSLLLFNALQAAQEEMGNQERWYFQEGGYNDETAAEQREDFGDSVARAAEDAIEDKHELAVSMGWTAYRVTEFIYDMRSAGVERYDLLEKTVNA